MRNFKRFLAMTLTMLMVVSSFALISSAKFEDVTDFQNEITVLSNLGVIKGKADGTFGFDEAVTRRQEALFIARAKTGKVDDTNWSSTVNNSKFTDLDATNDYYGAISYCANLGIIVGRKGTTNFGPNDKILFQDAITMVVRALGFGVNDNDVMNSGYPYSYYDKAVSLGLDKGIENVAMDDVVSRGVAAKLLYNAMFAKNSTGSTMAADAFGAIVKSTSVVLISASGKTLVNGYERPAADGTVSFCEFNADGSFNLAKVYNMNWKAFVNTAFAGDDKKVAADYIGHSFSVTTIDGFATLASATLNPSKTFTQADADGSGKIGDTTYTRVSKWTTVFNTGTTWSGSSEIQQFNTFYNDGKAVGKTVYYGGHYYLVNEANDILDKNGNVLLYYKAADANWVNNTPYAYKIGNVFYPAYLPVDGSAYPNAATADLTYKANATYAVDKLDKKFNVNVSSYADTIAFDDDNDGLYDRAYFTNYNFGQFFKFVKDGHTYYNVTLGAKGNRYYSGNPIDGAERGLKDIGLTNLSGKDVNDGAYVLWSRDAVNGNLIIKKVYGAAKIGFVTSVNPFDKSITVMNTTTSIWPGIGASEKLYYGVAKLPGATATNSDLTINDDGTGAISAESLIGIKYDLQGTTITYVVDEDRGNRIVAIGTEAAADEPMVVDEVLANNYALPYLTLRVVMKDGKMQNIYVSKVNNQQIYGYTNSTYGIEKGTLLLGAKLGQLDGIGNVDNWKVNIISPLPLHNNVAGKLNFYNGIAYENQPSGATGAGAKFIMNASGANTFSFQHKDGNLVIVARNTSGSFSIAKGIPVQGSELSIPAGSTIYADSSKGYMYINTPADTYVTFGAGFTVYNGSWQTGAVGNDIVYFEAGNPIGNVYENDYFYPTSYFVYQGGNASGYWSMMSGKANKDVSEFIYSKTLLTSGTFYYIKDMTLNGATVKVIDSAVTITDLMANRDNTNFAIRPTILKTFANGSSATIIKADGSTEFVPGNVAVLNWTNNNRGAAIATADATKFYLAFEYAGDTTNYMVPGVKYYFVTSTIDNSAAAGYVVRFNNAVETAALEDGCTIVTELTLVNGVLGYNTTVTLTSGYEFNSDVNFTESGATVFLPLSAFNNNHTVRVQIVSAN